MKTVLACSLCAMLFLSMIYLAGCQQPDQGVTEASESQPLLTSYADTVAWRAYEAAGGTATWASVQYLRFDFGVEREGVAGRANKHLWHRATGDYRLEMPVGTDTTWVILFNIHTRQGAAYLDGQPQDSTTTADLLERAYRRFINDTYWLLAPLKLFDPGVSRSHVADSSDATTDVLHLAFESVGLTPGDQYWVSVDKPSGQVSRWQYRLESGREGDYRWTGYETYTLPTGTIQLATRKEAIGRPAAILTDHVSLPSEVPADLFTDPLPRL